MTRSTQQTLIALTVSVFSLGVIGWIIWKVGILDFMLTMVINLAVLFPVMGICFLSLNPDTYNQMMDTLNDTKDAINNAASKVVPGQTINIGNAIPKI
jgi:hypothetical protein